MIGEDQIRTASFGRRMGRRAELCVIAGIMAGVLLVGCGGPQARSGKQRKEREE